MTNRTDLLDQLAPLFPPSVPPFEAFQRRRDRKRRNRRIAAGAVGLAIAIALIAVVIATRIDRGRSTSVPGDSPTPKPGPILPSVPFAFASGGDDNGRPVGSIQVYVEDQSGATTQLTQDGSPHANNEPESWSPDGSQLTVQRDSIGGQDLFLVNADGSGETRLTHDREWDGGSQFSPDGTKIAWVKQESHGMRLYVMNADGTGARPISPAGREVGSHDSIGAIFAWSPDGSQLVFSLNRHEKCCAHILDDAQIYVVNVDGSDLHRLTAPGMAGIDADCVTDGAWTVCGRFQGPAWSPDGSKIAVIGITSNSASYEIYLMNADGTDVQQLTGNPGEPHLCSYPVWSPDGSKILVSCRDGTYVVDADGTGITHVAPAGSSGDNWSPDGLQLGITVYGGPHAESYVSVYIMRSDGSGLTRAADDGRNDWGDLLWRSIG
jgi:Tol biopolymer transport system component